MTVVRETCTSPRRVSPRLDHANIRVGLLGLGQVGSAVAALALTTPAAVGRTIRITSGLVRDPGARARMPGVRITTDPAEIFEDAPDVIVELLGGLEPARSLVLEALARGVPVVTANKSLLAHHGPELLRAAHDAGVPLRYEASVIAGVPFLDTLARRPLAASLSSLTGIVNGASNYILSRMERGAGYRAALAEAQRCGFAEPDPAKDVEGTDALEKLVILLQQFTGSDVSPDSIEVSGILGLHEDDLVHARELGGAIKPVVFACWRENDVEAFAGPAFVPFTDPLAGLHGTTNGIRLRDQADSVLCFTGPGAGPAVTAVTVLDDVLDAAGGMCAPPIAMREARVRPPITRWVLRATGRGRLPGGAAIADLLGGYGVWAERTSAGSMAGRETVWMLTYPCSRQRIDTAASAVAAGAQCDTLVLRALNPSLEKDAWRLPY
jgi:homoserine dehydrogenase